MADEPTVLYECDVLQPRTWSGEEWPRALGGPSYQTFAMDRFGCMMDPVTF